MVNPSERGRFIKEGNTGITRVPETLVHRSDNFSIAADYSSVGSQELLLLLPGIGCTKDSFIDIWRQGGFEDLDILVPDPVGVGGSSKGSDFSYNLEDHARSVQELVREVPHKELHVVGHSMGGSIGVLLAEQTEDLASFTSVEGKMTPGSKTSLSKIATSVPFPQFADHGFEALRREKSVASDRGNRLWAQWSGTCDPLAFYKSSLSLIEWSDSGELLKRFVGLNTRKAYIYGGNNAGKATIPMPDIPMIGIPNSGHFVMNDNPTAFYPVLSRFLHAGV